MTADRFAAARTVADAVLYEGYVLYPYRASAGKNQVRWQFGVLAPPAWAAAEGSERSANRTEVVVEVGAAPILDVRIRCLQLQRRTVDAANGAGLEPTGALRVGDAVFGAWDEAVEHEFDVGGVDLRALVDDPRDVAFALPAREQEDLLHHGDGGLAGRLVRRCDEVGGVVHLAAETVGDGALRLTVEVRNTEAWDGPAASRDDALAHSLLAVHTLLAVTDGSFVSAFDPPDGRREAVASSANEGTFPVLVGDGADDVVLSSPIILYDHPAIAPESPGDLYDGTEIDEILALRILTLTDEEKAEARGTDARAAAIVDRCDDMPPEIWERLHGAVRSIGEPTPAAAVPSGGDADAGGIVPWDPGIPIGGDAAVPWWDPGADASVDPWTDTVVVRGVAVTKGTTVRLRPSRRADAHDLFVADRLATVAGVFHDVDEQVHVAVTLADDPAADLFDWQGRYWYFFPDEIEPVDRVEGGAVTAPRVLVAGIGNLFFGDDGFGGEVARRLAGRPMPDGVRVEDFGIRGLHLAYELLDGWDALVLIDAVPMGEVPGTLALIEPHPPGGDDAPAPALDAHTMAPAAVLQAMARLGGEVDRIVIVGCQPGSLDASIGLSPTVAAAVEPAADEVVALVGSLCHDMEEARG